MFRRKPSRVKTDTTNMRRRHKSRIGSYKRDHGGDDDNFTVTIPNSKHELSAKDKWQLTRFYNDK